MPSSSSSVTTSERTSNSNQCKNQTEFFIHKMFCFFLATSPKNLLPLRLDERKDCEFALPFHYEGDSSTHPGTSLINI
jgi:hypothetical protein